MSDESEEAPVVTELGAALRIFQCGSDLNIQGSREALRRLAHALEAAVEGSQPRKCTYLP